MACNRRLPLLMTLWTRVILHLLHRQLFNVFLNTGKQWVKLSESGKNWQFKSIFMDLKGERFLIELATKSAASWKHVQTFFVRCWILDLCQDKFLITSYFILNWTLNFWLIVIRIAWKLIFDQFNFNLLPTLLI